jgi:probable DNA metabolism protein
MMMYRVHIDPPCNFVAFRDAARGLLAASIRPEQVNWQEGLSSDLFCTEPPPRSSQPISLPAPAIELARDAICHRDPERSALIYRLLWRIVQGERSLLLIATDPLVSRLRQMQKSVHRDTHKMTAFVRFRRIEDETGERYVAWFEPEHHILRRVSTFFVERFASMRWSILTPDGSLHWDGAQLRDGPAVSPHDAPREDQIEDWWRSYYRSTFNPARANPDLMRAEMPKKYWRNLPEAAVIQDLLAEAERRTDAMIEAPPLAPRKAKDWTPPEPAVAPSGTLASLKAEVSACRRCPLWKPATQSVFGEGAHDAPVVFVGEQPGDQERPRRQTVRRAGRPVVLSGACRSGHRAKPDLCHQRGEALQIRAARKASHSPEAQRR